MIFDFPLFCALIPTTLHYFLPKNLDDSITPIQWICTNCGNTEQAVCTTCGCEMVYCTVWHSGTSVAL